MYPILFGIILLFFAFTCWGLELCLALEKMWGKTHYVNKRAKADMEKGVEVDEVTNIHCKCHALKRKPEYLTLTDLNDITTTNPTNAWIVTRLNLIENFINSGSIPDLSSKTQ